MFLSASFLAAAFVLAVIPGPGMAYVVARTVAGGRSEGLASSAGTAVGGMVHVVASAFGLALLIAQSPTVYAGIKYLGAAYLVYLGIRILTQRPSLETSSVGQLSGPARAFKDGVAVETLNVKTAMFFIAFIPQFVQPNTSFIWQFVLMGTVCVVLNTSADLIAVMAASRLLASEETRRRRERALSRLSGSVMILLGIVVACAGSHA